MQTNFVSVLTPAFNKANISSDLQKEFLKFLSDFPEYGTQAVYLLSTKKLPIETVIKDLFAVPEKDQYSWTKEKEIAKQKATNNFLTPSSNKIVQKIIPKLRLEDFKKNHGSYDNIQEIGQKKTVIRLEKIPDNNKEGGFKWELSNSIYKKAGWKQVKKIKSINNLFTENDAKIGKSALSFIKKKINHPINKKDPTTNNSLYLNNTDSHCLLKLLLGSQNLYYKGEKEPITNSFVTLKLKLSIFELTDYFVISGFFTNLKGKNLKIYPTTFIAHSNYLEGCPNAILYNNLYYQLAPTSLSLNKINELMLGIKANHDELAAFKTLMGHNYPDLTINKVTDIKYLPNFSKHYPTWQQWLRIDKNLISNKSQKSDLEPLRLEIGLSKKNIDSLDFKIKNSYEAIQKNIAANPDSKLWQFIAKKITAKAYQKELLINCHLDEAANIIELLRLHRCVDQDNKPIFFKDSSIKYRLTFEKGDNYDNYSFYGSIFQTHKNNQLKKLPLTKLTIVGNSSSFIIYKGRIACLSNFLSANFIHDTLTGINIQENQIYDFYCNVLPLIKQKQQDIDDPQGLLRVSALYNYSLQAHMLIFEDQGELKARLTFVMITDIGKFKYSINNHSDKFYQNLDGNNYLISRNIGEEKKILESVYSHGWLDKGSSLYAMDKEQALNFVLEVLPNYDKKGSLIYHGEKNLKVWKINKIVPKIVTELDTKVSWFDFKVKVAHKEQEFSIQDLVKMWEEGKQNLNPSADNGITLIDKDWLRKNGPVLQQLLETNKNKQSENQEQFQLGLHFIGLVNYLQELGTNNKYDEKWSVLKEQLLKRNFKSKHKIPESINKYLRDYQKTGVKWLIFLKALGFCGILADDMGLGKTLQTIAFLAVNQQKDKPRPNLVVAPTSVQHNWINEIKKFAPHFNSLLLQGPKRLQLMDKIEQSDIVVTSYNLLQRDLNLLRKIKFSVIVLDEAQMIKNYRSKNFQSVNQLCSDHRLSLTGTPIENSVSELWAQFNFLMPGFLDYNVNIQRIANNNKNISANDRLEILCKQTTPFILRRLKSNVAPELPAKTEQILYCEMGRAQQNLYDKTMQYIKLNFKKNINANNFQKNRFLIFDFMLKLRQICCDPRLFTPKINQPPNSAKFKLFLETINEIVKEGHRVLVFSQFVKMLKLMHEPLQKKSIKFLQLDGSIRDRQKLVENFQNNCNYNAFLISLKAGGTGINLTAADYVIHYDPWWNPAAENQATDRAHRIGQKNRVHVYKLITKDSIEEKIQLLQKKKQNLTNKIIKSSTKKESFVNFEDIANIFEI